MLSGIFDSVAPTQSEVKISSTKVTDRLNYIIVLNAQHKYNGNDKSVKKKKLNGQPLKCNVTESTIETKQI